MRCGHKARRHGILPTLISLSAIIGADVCSYADPPAITTVRYDEDYSYLRDPAARTGDPWALEPLKYVPLDDRGDAYLTLGGELRTRYEWYDNNAFGDGPQDDGGYVWGRALPYADLHVGPNFRAFGQLIAAFEWEDQTGPAPPDEDRFDLLQGFVDVVLPMAGEATLTLRPGRQMLSYGSERLISTRYGPNVPRSFDAMLASLHIGPWLIDGFFARPVDVDPGTWDNQSDDAISTWALYLTRRVPAFGDAGGIDAYYIGYANDQADFDQGSGDEQRHTFGARLFGARASWDWDLEGMYQCGDYTMLADNGDIMAWSVASAIGYTFETATLRPRVGLKANLISGDDDPSDPDLGTFNPLFPRGKYFGEIGLIGPSNLINLHPSLDLYLTDQLTLGTAAVFYWRFSDDDAVYDNAGNILRADSGSDERYIGTQLDVVLTYAPRREIEISVAYSAFLPGDFIDDTGSDEPVHFVGIEVLFRF